MKQSVKGLLMVLFSGLVFGCVPAAVRLCYEQGAHPEMFVFFRYASLTLVLLPFVLRKKGAFRVYVKHIWAFIILSLMSVATPMLLYIDYTFSSTSIATTIHFMYPALVAIGSVLVLKQKLTKRRLISVILCGGGILLMLELGGLITVPGVLIAFASAVTWAVYILVMSKLDVPEFSTEHILFFVSAQSLILISAIALIDGSFIDCVQNMTGLGWTLLPIIGVVTSVFGILFFAIGIRKTDAQVAAIASTLEPIVSILIGIIFLGEPFSVRTIIGSVMILTAVVLLALPAKESGKEPPKEPEAAH